MSQYMSIEDCKASGQHLQVVDTDGYCGGCGEQEEDEPTRDFRVTWEADVVAENPEAAAQYARAMQTRPGTTATVFEVFEEGKEPVRMDLLELEEYPPVLNPALVEEEVIDAGSGSDLATILASLRLFQKKYFDCGSDSIRADFPEHFADCSPLGSEDIDALCERLNSEEPNKEAEQVASLRMLVSEIPGQESYDELDRQTAIDFVRAATAVLYEGYEPEVLDGIQPRVLVTISGGAGEVAENVGGVIVDILDYDNVSVTVCECGESGKRDLQLSPAELAYIRAHDDAGFVERVEAALVLSEAELEAQHDPSNCSGCEAQGIPQVSDVVTDPEELAQAAELALVMSVVNPPKCPKCGQVGAIELMTDAWEKREVLGFDAEGNLVVSTLTDTWTGDDIHYECTECGEIIDEDKIEEPQQ